MEYALLQAVFLPLLLSPVAYILGRKLGPTPAMWFTFAILLYTTILVINAALSGTVEEHYPWTEQFGEFGFLLDGLASPFAIMIYVLSTIFGATVSISIVINLIDGMYAIMAIPTMVSTILLAPKVMKETRRYFSLI